MEQVIVAAVRGQAFFVEYSTGQMHPVREGMVLAEGDILLTSSNGEVELRQSGREMLLVGPSQQLEVVDNGDEQPLDIAGLASQDLTIEQIQQALLSGQDPTAVIEAPAAIALLVSSAHNSGADLLRHAKATLAQAGYDTEYRRVEPEVDDQFGLASQASQATGGILPIQFQLLEGEGEQGNLIVDTGAQLAGFGQLLLIAGRPLVEWPLVSDGEFVGARQVSLPYGEFYVYPDGSYAFQSLPSLDHSSSDSLPQIPLNLTFQDAFGGIAETTVIVTIDDGADPQGITADAEVTDAGGSDEAQLRIFGGSDAIDASTLGFDVAAIVAGLTPLQLTNQGVALDLDNLSVTDTVLLISDVNGNPVLQLTLQPPLLGNNDLFVTVTATSLAPLDHVDNALQLPIFLAGSDSDGDPFSAELLLTVTDTVPLAADVSNSLSETEGGSQVAGNLLDNTQFGADGAAAAGGVTVVNGVDLSTQTAISGGEFDGYIQVDVDNGTLYVKPTGEYIFVADDNLDHGAGTQQEPEADIVFDVPFTVEDFDGDLSDANLNLTIVDGAAPTAATVSVDVSDDGSSDQVNLVIERGSDQLDPASFGFDTDAISSAIAALNLTSGGVAVDGSNLSVSNGVLTVFDANNNPVLSVTLGNPTDNNGDLSFPVTVNPLAPLDHLGSGNGASLSLPIFIKGQDSDNDPVTGQVTVNVADTSPTAAGVSNQVTEAEGGAQVAGNLLDNTQFGADGAAAAGGVTVVNSVDLSTQTAISGGAFDGYIEVAVDNGTLYVKPTGEYIFVADDNLDHGAGTAQDPEADIVFDVPFTVEDFDGDPSNANLNLTIVDGAAPTAATVSVDVSDDGSSDQVNLVVERGSDQLDPASFGFDTGAISNAIAALNLTSAGGAVDGSNLTLLGSTLTILDGNDNPVLEVILGLPTETNGDLSFPVTVNPLAPLDHFGAGNDTSFSLPIFIKGQDSDNDPVSGQVTVNVADTTPTAAGVSNQVIETEGGAQVAGNLLDNTQFGADGAAAAGGVTVVNGVDLSTQTAINGGAFDGYIEVAVDNGSLYVKPTGEYIFVADDNLDHGAGTAQDPEADIVFDVPFTVEDFDGDPSDANLNLTIVDGAAPTAEVVAVELTDGLDSFTVFPTFTRGSDQLDPDSVAFDVAAIAAALADAGLTSVGVGLDLDNIYLTPSGSTMIIRDLNGNEVIKATLNPLRISDGEITAPVNVQIVAPLDHQGDQPLEFPLYLSASDIDNDSAQARIDVTVIDGDGPSSDGAAVTLDDGVDSFTVRVLFEPGSDPLVSDTVAFDIAAIQQALAPLQLSSGGADLNLDNIFISGNTLIIRDVDGNEVIKATINQVDQQGDDVSVAVNVQLVAPLDHQGDQLQFPVILTIDDSDGDSVHGQIAVTVTDAEPQAGDVSNSLTETEGGSQVSGNLLDNTQLGADGAIDGGAVVTVNGVQLAQQPQVLGGEFDGYIEVAVDNGTLYVKSTGEYIFVADDNLDHGAGTQQEPEADIVFDVPFTVEDFDGDPADANLNLTIVDGAVPTAATVSVDVSDDGSSDQVNLVVERGSDQLDPASFGFDTDAISSAIAALNLTSEGVAVDGSNFTLQGSTLTILDGNDNPVLEVILGLPTETNGDLSFPVTVNPLAPLDHLGAGNDASLGLPIFIKGKDSDNDPVTGQVTVNVADTTPTAAGVSNQVTEAEGGAQVSGNLLDNTQFGADGAAAAGGVTVVNGVDLSTQTAISGGAFDGYIEVAVDNGTLYVKPTGEYIFVADDNLDHGDPESNIVFDVPFTVEDFDGDPSDANLNLTIVDGAAPTAATVSVDVSDDGSDDQVNLVIERGSDQLDPASFSFDTDAISSAIAALNLTSAGVAVDGSNLSVTNGVLTVFDANNNPVLSVTLGNPTDSNGDLSFPVTVNPLAPLDHLGADNDASLSLPIFIKGKDRDNDPVTGQVSVNVDDTSPTAAGVSNQVTEAEGGAQVSGNLLDNTQFGADGAAAAGGVTVVNGVDLSTQTAISGGAFDGYIEVAVDNGTLYVKPSGEYIFVADDNLDHGDPESNIVFDVPFTVEDFDGDPSDANLNLTIVDGAAPTAATVSVDVSDDGSDDQVNLVVERGSDQLDPASFGFDTDAISSAIAALNLTSAGVAVDGSNFTLQGSTLTILDGNDNPVLEVILGLPTATNGDLSFPVTVNPLAPLDHLGAGNDASLSLPIFIKGQDSDNDPVTGQVTVNVADTSPTAAGVSNQVTEAEGGAQVSGNLLDNTQFGADGAAAAGGVTVVNGVDLSTQTAISGGAFDGYIEVDVDNGTLYVKPSGEYIFVADDNLDHGAGTAQDLEADIVFDVPFTVEDFDGDPSDANLNLTIVDGAAASAATVSVDVSDDGSSDQVNLVVERGSDQLEPASFGFDTDAISSAIAALNLTSAGVAVDGSNFTLQGSTLTILDGNDNPVLEVILGLPTATNGDLSFPVTVNPLAPLDHLGAGNDASLSLPIFIKGQDSDNDPVTGQVTANVADTTPTAAGVSNQVTEAEGGAQVSGNLLDNTQFGADGAAAAGGVTVVNGVQLSTQTAISGGEFDGYIEVDVDNGTLYVKPTGEYIFVADDNLDHGAGTAQDPEADIVFDVPFTVEDFDGDPSDANLNLTIVDGAAPTAATVSVDVSDDGSSDQVNLVVERGSDQLDPASFGFDTDAISSAIAALNITSTGVAVDGSNLSVTNGVLTVFDANNNPVLSVTLGSPTDNNGVLSFPVTVNPLAPLDHLGDGNDASLSLPIFIKGKDSDNDPVTGQVTVNVADTTPTAAGVSNQVTEAEGGAQVSGNLLDNTQLGADGAIDGGAVVTVNGVQLAQQPQVLGGEFDGYIEVAVDNGTLYVKPTGEYIFVADDNLDHGDPESNIVFDVPFTVEDFDGDPADANLNLTIVDGAAPTAATVSVDVSDDGSSDQVNLVVERGSDQLDPASFGFDTDAITSAIAALNLTSTGVAVDGSNLSVTNGVLTVFDANNNPVLSVTLGSPTDNNGDLSFPVTVNPLAPLDHLGAGNDASLSLPIFIKGKDSDNDPVSGQVTVNVADTTPTAAGVSNQVTEAEGGAQVSGNLLDNTQFGADGAAATGGVTVVNGVDLSTQTAISGGAFDGYIEVAVDNGTLYVKPTGEYIFVADDNLDHGDPESNIVFDVPFTVEDFDGDPSDANLNLIIVDGAAATAATVSVDVSDDGSSDQVNLVVERGSDQLDPASFGFDTDTISSAIAALNLTSGGVAVDGSNFTLQGSTLTILDGHDNPVLEVILGLPTETNGDLSFPVTVNPLAPLDHLGAGNDASLSLPIFIKGKDSDNDPVSGQVTVNVADTSPTAAGVSNQVTEVEGGAQVAGNLLDNTQFGADGAAAAGGVSVVNGVDLSTQTAISGGAFDGYIEVAVDNGTLYVKPTGEYIFVADDNLDHGAGTVQDPEADIVFDVPFTVEDFDGDPSNANLNLTIVDGAAPTAATVSVDVSDDGSDDQVNLVVERGSDQLDPASFGFDTDAISSAIAALNLTSAGVAVDGSNFTLQGSTLTILDGNDNPVLEVILGLPTETNGDLSFPVTVNPLAPLDHLGSGNNASLSLPIFIKGQDSDNDPVSGQVTVNVADTTPTAAGVSNQVTEAEGGAQVAGNLLDNTQFGADGAAAAGGVTVVNGVDLSTQTAISGGAFDGYIEVDVDNGTLYVKPTGEYIFVADDNLDHGDPESNIVFDVPFTVEDFDGDPSNANLNLTIIDGAAPTAAAVGLSVDEDGNLTDSGSVRFQRGSDQLDLSTIGFDLAATIAALENADLDAISGAVDADATTINGGVMTLFDVNGNALMTISLGLANSDVNGDVTVPISVQLLAGFDHDDSALDLPVVVGIGDSDNDSTTAAVTITVVDGEPNLPALTLATVTEGQIGTEVNVFENADFALDGGRVTSVNGVALDASNFITDISDANFGYHAIDSQYGTVFIKSDGSYRFEADSDIDHGVVELLSEQITISARDGDDDPVTVNLNQGIADGAVPTSAGVDGSVVVAESTGLSQITQQLQFERGSDPITSVKLDAVATASAISQLFGADLPTSKGSALDLNNLSLNPAGTQLVISNELGEPVLQLDISAISSDNDGNWSLILAATSLQGLDHLDVQSIALPIVVTANDQDNDGVSQTTSVVVTDAEPLPQDDSGTMVEGTVGSGNLLTNDNVGTDGASVSAVRIDGSLLTVPQTGVVEIAVSSVPIVIQTRAGELTINPNGSWSLDAPANQSHPNDAPVVIPFEYRLTDGDEDVSGWVDVTLSVTDGAVRPGGETINQSVTEGDLANNSGASTYPKSVSSTVALNDVGSDQLNLSSFGLAIDTTTLALELISELKTDGTGLSSVISGSSITLRNQATGELVLTLDYSISMVNGQPTVQADTTLYAPLDHIKANDSTAGVVSIGGGNIVIQVPLQVQDSDGDPLQNPVTVTTTIKDGSKPGISMVTKPMLNEDLLASQASISADGVVKIKVNSDEIDGSTLMFKGSGHTALTSNGEAIVYSVDPTDSSGRTLLGKVGNQLVLKVELNSTPSAATDSDVSYTVTQYAPIDQDVSKTATFKIKVTDVDGDTKSGGITVDFIDGDNASFSLSGNVHQLTEHNLGDPAQQINSTTAGQLNNLGSITLVTDSDPVSNVYFDFTDEQVLAGVTHAQQPIQLFLVNGTWQAWSMDGANQDTLVFTLESPLALDSNFEVAANTTVQVPYQITWHSFVDQPTDTNSLTINLPVVAEDADGDTTSANVSLTILDGNDPTIDGIDVAAGALAEVNRGSVANTAGTLIINRGSDQAEFSVDTVALQASMDNFTSDGRPLTVALVNGEYHVTRPDGSGGSEIVMVITVADIGSYSVQLRDNLEHIQPGNDSSLSFGLPIILADSDGDSATITPQITIIDSDISASNDLLYSNGSVGEGETVAADAGNGLLSNDQLGADADRANITTVRYQNSEYPLVNGAVTISTDLGSVTVNSDGSWSFTAAAGLDHSSAATLVDSFDYRVLDGDNDSDWATASFSVADDAPVLTAVGGQGLEDAANIPLMVEVNLGDVDQNEVISNLLIDAPAAAAGELYLNGSALAINADNQVQIPVAATVITVSNGQTIVSVAGLTFVPTADYADNSGGALQLGVSVDVSSSVDGSTTLTDTLDISVLAQADQITWLDRDLTIKEDPAGFGERLFMSASNPDGIYAITNDADGSETLSYRIDSIPAGVTLYLNGNPIAVGTELTQAQAERVRVKPDEHDAGQFTIGITAIATEQGSDDQVDLRSRELPADITLNVQPVVDTPTLEFAVAGAGVRNRRIKINEDEFVSFGRYLKFASPDENEVTYLRVEEVATDGSNGVIFYNDQGQWVSLTELQQNGDPLPDGISWDGTGFIIREDVLADVAYRPAEDRSSANFDDVRLQFTAISQEITQDGLAPEPAEFEATSAETLFLNFNIRGVVDAPMLDEVNGFSNERNNQGEPTGRILYDGNEDQALTVNLALMSTDDDGSEVLNYLLRHLPPGFVIADSSGNPPTLAGFEEVEINGQMQTIPIYQISADEMANGTYQITPPSDYAGEVELLIAATITELDGASADYQKPLIWTLKPVVDSVDSNGSASGVEVEVDDVGDYRSGGASIRRGNWLKDIDGSERIEDVAITAPAGFAILYQGQFYQSIGSLQQLTGGDSASVNALLDSGDLILVPATEENGNWTIDADAPPPVSGTNVSLAVTVADQQNGLETIASTPINVTVAVSWRGEVDGDSLFEDGQGDEATGLVGPDQTVVSDGGVLRLGDLIGFVSTDVDGSEQVDSYRIELPQGSQWSLRDSNGTPIGTNIGNGVWLLNQDSLAGVLLQGHDDGDFSIRVVALISDLGDVEARQVDFTVSLSNTVPVNNGGDGGDNGGGDNGDGNNDGDGIVGGVNGELFTDIVTGSEDGRDRDGNPDAASWQGLTDASVYGDDNDSVSFRVDVSDLPSGARLNGNVTEVWDNDGNVVAYIIQEADLDSVSLALANNDSGSFTIPLTVIITDPASGDTYLDDDGNLPTTELTVEIAAVADGVNIALNGEGIETADSDDNERFPLGLSLTPRDGDGSETVTSVLLTPQTGVTLFGDGLQLTADGYQLTRQNGETDAQWQGRIDSIEFYSEPGLTHQLAIGVEVTSVDSNNLGSDQRVQSQPLSVFVAPINNRVDLNANDVSGDEDNPFSIAGISAVLNDADETMSLLLEGVPEGSFLSINGEPLPYNGDGVWQIPVELLNPDGSLPSIDYLPPADTSGEYQLTLRAISSDDEVAEFAEDTLNFMLNINPVADDIALEVASEISGSEGQTVAVDFDLDTSDNFSDAVDQAEAVLLQFSLDPSSDSTLAGGDGKPPAIIVAGTEYPLTLVNGIWQVEVEVAGAVDNQLLQSISFNSGDGFGEGNLNISASAIDRSGSLPQSTGTAVTTSIPLAILPTPDLPQLSAPTSVTGGAAIALAITAAVVNPAVEELSVVISGISSGQLQDGDGNPVGTLQANGDLLLMPTELDGLQWVGASDGDYPLSVSAVSSIGDAAVSSSTTIDVSVDNSADDDAFDAGLMLADDDDEAADSEAAPAPAAEPEPLDLGDILQNPEQQQALDDLLQNAQFAISPEDDDGNVDIVVNLDGDDALILNNVDLDQWQVGADDPDGFLDKFIEEYRQQLQQD